jgi:hypothetical protein
LFCRLAPAPSRRYTCQNVVGRTHALYSRTGDLCSTAVNGSRSRISTVPGCGSLVIVDSPSSNSTCGHRPARAGDGDLENVVTRPPISESGRLPAVLRFGPRARGSTVSSRTTMDFFCDDSLQLGFKWEGGQGDPERGLECSLSPPVRFPSRRALGVKCLFDPSLWSVNKSTTFSCDGSQLLNRPHQFPNRPHPHGVAEHQPERGYRKTPLLLPLVGDRLPWRLIVRRDR